METSFLVKKKKKKFSQVEAIKKLFQKNSQVGEDGWRDALVS
jgi:hypothetical protein